MIKSFAEFYGESFEPKRIEDRAKDPIGVKMGQRLQAKKAMRVSLIKFHKKLINLKKLRGELLAINPYDVTEVRHQYWIDWIDQNVNDYERGETFVFSMNSSGSILNGWDDEDEYE